MLFPYFLIFLFPLGVYLLVLATINRRQRPFMISGVWDAVMLSSGLSGIFLWIGPALLGTFYERGYWGDPTNRQFEQVWQNYPWIWVAYYALVIGGQVLMVTSRRNKTVVYNVDAAALETVIARVFEEKGFRTSLQHGLVMFEMKGDAAASGLVDVEAFRPLRNATLTWHHDDHRLRRSIEAELETQLVDAATADNPSVSWLLGVSGLIFGAVVLGAIFVILMSMVRGF